MMEALVDYGMAGMFIGYLIYDRQVIIKKLIVSIDRLSERLR